ncbi:MAG: hypothetical protein JRE45_21200 [Deltaproteobacteria bacterium]|nr:hypothetical protein [Deltaproteobacteria bacterium]
MRPPALFLVKGNLPCDRLHCFGAAIREALGLFAGFDSSIVQERADVKDFAVETSLVQHGERIAKHPRPVRVVHQGSRLQLACLFVSAMANQGVRRNGPKVIDAEGECRLPSEREP